LDLSRRLEVVVDDDEDEDVRPNVQMKVKIIGFLS